MLLCAFLAALSLSACGNPSSGDPPSDGGNGVDPPQNTGVRVLTFEEDVRSDYVNWFGRNVHNATYGAVICNNSAAGFEVSFWGTELSVSYISEVGVKGFMDGDCYICVQVDGSDDYVSSFTHLPKRSAATPLRLAQGLEEGSHTVAVYKATEDKCASLEFYSMSTDGFFVEPPAKKELKIEAYGDSITAGQSVMRAEGDAEANSSTLENAMLTYGAYAARELGAQYSTFCISGSRVGSYVTNDTADIIPRLYTKYSPTASAKQLWDFTNYTPDAVLVDLGTNDIISSSATEDFESKYKQHYVDFVSALRKKYPDACIVLCGGTFTYSKIDVTAYNDIIRQVAAEFEEDGNVLCLVFSADVKGHPTYLENEIYGGQLAQLLRTRLSGRGKL